MVLGKVQRRIQHTICRLLKVAEPMLVHRLRSLSRPGTLCVLTSMVWSACIVLTFCGGVLSHITSVFKAYQLLLEFFIIY